MLAVTESEFIWSLTDQLYQFGIDTASLGLGIGEVAKTRKTALVCAMAVATEPASRRDDPRSECLGDRPDACTSAVRWAVVAGDSDDSARRSSSNSIIPIDVIGLVQGGGAPGTVSLSLILVRAHAGMDQGRADPVR